MIGRSSGKKILADLKTEKFLWSVASGIESAVFVRSTFQWRVADFAEQDGLDG